MTNPLRALFELRSIGNSADLLELLLKGGESIAGTSVNERTALNIAAVMTCVSLIGRTVASLPIRAYERLDGRSKQPAENHPLSGLLRKPNSWQTRLEFILMMQTHLLLRGNAYAWINRSPLTLDGSEQIQELVPLHPDRVDVTQLEDWSLAYTLTRRTGQKMPLPSTEVFHLRGLSTDGIKGRSTLEDARDVIGVALATQEHAGSFWRRDATPSVVLTHPKSLSDKAQKNLEEKFEQTYGGGKDKRRVAVLEEGMELTPLSVSPNDAQFLETRKFQRSEIAGWFHVPPHMIGDTEKSTSWGTGIEQQQIAYLTFTIRPWLVAWEQRLNLDLITNRARFFLEFNVDGLLRGDITSRYNAYWRGIQGGWLSPNDVRALENMNPIEGGDVYLAPTNLAPLTSFGDLIAPQPGTSA